MVVEGLFGHMVAIVDYSHEAYLRTVRLDDKSPAKKKGQKLSKWRSLRLVGVIYILIIQ
jgi:hypothetical protein